MHKQTSYEGALRAMLHEYRTWKVATFVAGDSNINTKKKGCVEWLMEAELRASANPRLPAHRSGTVDDAILVAVGSHVPGAVLPG